VTPANETGLSGGQIAGIVIGSVAGVALAAAMSGMAVYFHMRNRCKFIMKCYACMYVYFVYVCMYVCMYVSIQPVTNARIQTLEIEMLAKKYCIL
jgi:hypothetical protein